MLQTQASKRGVQLGVFLAALLVCAPGAQAGAPEWLKAAAKVPLPQYPEDVDAVLLLDEKLTRVRDNGEIFTEHRQAYKILRPQGREHGKVVVHFDSETRLTFLKGWCLPAIGKEYEVKEKDAIEFSPFDVELYSDSRAKVLTIPAADVGNVVGWEYEQKVRPYILQDVWSFQDPHPLKRGRYTLELPEGWEFEARWMNFAARDPQSAANSRWVWEVSDVEAVEPESSMPPWQAVAGRLVIRLFPRQESLREKSLQSWKDAGYWQWQLASGRDLADAAIRQKVAELTAGKTSLLDKMKALAAFAQRDIRYVAIEIGIGGLQPHAAPDIFRARYGDCKDKATLLRVMLREIGVESYYVSIDTKRGEVGPDTPPGLWFNHRILALRLPPEIPTATLYAVHEHEKLGRLLFFDPTHPYVPLGHLPESLQANYGLVWSEGGGELVELPLQRPATNRLLRTAKLALSASGALSGEVQEIRWGAQAAEMRGRLVDLPVAERTKVLESFLAGFLGGFKLDGLEIEKLDAFDDSLVIRYRFTAPSYAKPAGNLLLVRPRVVGQKSTDLLEARDGKERKYPLEFSSASLQSDLIEIALPEGFVVDELPPPARLDTGIVAYESASETEGKLLRYKRSYEVKGVRVPTERLPEMKKFYRQVIADERSSVVLKRAAP